jgi:glutamyl-tRNA synthetase
MHIGTARTALLNWLFARHHKGKFHIRIEDTDRARHSEEAVLAILNGMKWLELEWDGEVVSQHEQLNRHKEIAQKLIDEGKAYYCYASPEELEQMRVEARSAGKTVAYDKRWRDKSESEAPANIKPVIRIKAPLDGESKIFDHVQGEVTVKNENLDDFVLLRSDGTPTYMLSVVVDDHDMGITHVIRGDDHLNNAFRQKVIIEALGWDVPEYAHVPLIMGPDGKKLSKRHGAASVEEYKDMGYLPEAMRNYLLRLGWSHGDDEIISTDQAISWFNLENLGKAAARFDFDKLESINSHYLTKTDDEKLIELIDPYMHSRHELAIDELAKSRLLTGMSELKERSKNLLQLTDEAAFYCKKIPYEFDEKAQALIIDSKDNILPELCHKLSTLENFKADDIQDICKEIAQEHCEGKLGKVAMPFRACLTGTTTSPSIFHAAEILGKKESIDRINAALSKFDSKKQASATVGN